MTIDIVLYEEAFPLKDHPYFLHLYTQEQQVPRF